MSYVILNFSESQKNGWVRLGLEHCWIFEWCVTHNLGYNSVEAFNDAAYSIVVQAGNVYINESMVHSVMGFSNVTEVIKFDKDRSAYSHRGEQFPALKSFRITPTRVRNKILENHAPDENFKWILWLWCKISLLNPIRWYTWSLFIRWHILSLLILPRRTGYWTISMWLKVLQCVSSSWFDKKLQNEEDKIRNCIPIFTFVRDC